VLAIGTKSGLWDLGPKSLLVLETRGRLWELGPDLGFRAQGGLQELGSKSLLIVWPFCRVWVLGHKSGCRSSLQRWRLPWFRSLRDQHHAHDFSYSYDLNQQRLVGLRSYHDWQRCQVLLQLLKWLICFLSPDKGSSLPQELEELESPLYQSRDKLVEQGQASREPLDILMRAGGRTTSIALIFSGLASIRQCKTRKPCSFLVETPNTHLSGFNIVHIECNLSKTFGVVQQR
jgi:hypothetical protein